MTFVNVFHGRKVASSNFSLQMIWFGLELAAFAKMVHEWSSARPKLSQSEDDACERGQIRSVAFVWFIFFRRPFAALPPELLELFLATLMLGVHLLWSNRGHPRFLKTQSNS